MSGLAATIVYKFGKVLFLKLIAGDALSNTINLSISTCGPTVFYSSLSIVMLLSRFGFGLNKTTN